MNWKAMEDWLRNQAKQVTVRRMYPTHYEEQSIRIDTSFILESIAEGLRLARETETSDEN